MNINDLLIKVGLISSKTLEIQGILQNFSIKIYDIIKFYHLSYHFLKKSMLFIHLKFISFAVIDKFIPYLLLIFELYHRDLLFDSYVAYLY